MPFLIIKNARIDFFPNEFSYRTASNLMRTLGTAYLKGFSIVSSNTPKILDERHRYTAACQLVHDNLDTHEIYGAQNLRNICLEKLTP